MTSITDESIRAGIGRWRDRVAAWNPADIEAYRAAGAWNDITIGERLTQQAARTPEALALVAVDGALTFGELDRESDRIAAGLLAAGLTPGDTMLLQIGNELRSVVAYYALMKAGVIPVATLLVHRGHEIRQIGVATDAAAHLVDAAYDKLDLVEFARRMAAEAGTDRLVITTQPNAASDANLDDLGRGISPDDARRTVEQVRRQLGGGDIAMFQLSGGTTNIPKVIPRFHAEYWYNSASYAERLGWDHDVRFLHMLPVIHNAGIVCGVQATHSVGGTIVLGVAEPRAVISTIIDHGITDTLTYPGIAAELLADPKFGEACTSLRRIVLSGAAVPPQVFDAMEQRGVTCLGLYGAGEGMVMATPPDDDRDIRNHSVGSPVSSLDRVRIVDDDGHDVPEGEIGELWYTGPTALRGYLDQVGSTSDAISADGFYRSGDLVRAEGSGDDRRYYFCGRAKDNISRGGEKYGAAEIESVVSELPGVVRAAIVPVADFRLGERACLVLELAPEHAEYRLGDIQALLESREVAKFKWPEFLVHLDALPRTSVGKIDKRSLREHIATHPAITGVTSDG